MPSGFATLDTGFPNLKAMDSSDQQIKAVEDYLVQLLENLRYMLRNIGPENLNTTEMVQWLGETIEEPIKIALQNIEGTLIARIEIDEASLTSLYTKTGVNELGQSDTLYSKIAQNAEAISSEVGRATEAEGQLTTSVSTVEQKADSIRTEVSQVTAITANEWAASTNYVVGAYVKVTTGNTTAYYRCNAAHTSSNSNKPGTDGGADYWYPVPAQNAMQSQINQTASDITTKVSTADLISTINQSSDHISSSVVNTATNQTLASYVTQTDQAIAARVTNADMQSAINQSAGEIRSEVSGDITDEWAANVSFAVDDVTKVTTNGVAAYYKCIEPHNSAGSTKPGSGSNWRTYWELSDAQYAMNKRMSVISQRADGIYAQVTDGNGDYTVLNLKSDGLHVGNATGSTTISGSCITTDTITATQIASNTITANEIATNYVYAGTIKANQIQSGSVQVGYLTADYLTSDCMQAIEIDADQIVSGTIIADQVSASDVTSGTLNASNINVNGAFTIYNGNTAVGEIGAGYGYDGYSSTYGAYLSDSWGNNYVIATDSGVRMTARPYDVYVTSSMAHMGSSSKYLEAYSTGCFYNGTEIAVVSSSDRRVKTDIDYDMTPYEEFFMSLAPCTYRRTDIPDHSVRIGFIAQDIQGSLDENGLKDVGMVFEQAAPPPTMGAKTPIYGLHYEDFAGLSVHMIQKLMDRCDALEARIAELEGRNAS